MKAQKNTRITTTLFLSLVILIIVFIFHCKGWEDWNYNQPLPENIEDIGDIEDFLELKGIKVVYSTQTVNNIQYTDEYIASREYLSLNKPDNKNYYKIYLSPNLYYLGFVIYDSQGNIKTDPFGRAARLARFSNDGYILEYKNYNSEGEPYVDENGVFHFLSNIDPSGVKIDAFYGKDGERVFNEDYGYHRATYKINEFGFYEIVERVDENLQPITTNSQ